MAEDDEVVAQGGTATPIAGEDSSTQMSSGHLRVFLESLQNELGGTRQNHKFQSSVPKLILAVADALQKRFCGLPKIVLDSSRDRRTISEAPRVRFGVLEESASAVLPAAPLLAEEEDQQQQVFFGKSERGV